ncbi:MAG: hypothetical protein J6H18_03600, partial [Lachnospiraceae bacterium]|nr:hypothetical protein [Lachnospiraceae bacterium]
DSLEMQVHLIGVAETPEHISYELRDEKEERLIAKGKVSEFQEETGGCSFRLSFQDIISFDEYYYLRIQLPFGGREVLYDTRILKVSSRETVSMLTEYAIHLNRDLYRYDTARAYASHLETDTYSDKNTLAYVDLKSNLNQLAWGNASVSQKGEAWMSVKGIQDNYLYLDFASLAEAELGENQKVQFRVQESVSLQRYGMAIYLLNYERHVSQAWSFNEISVAEDGFLLGIQEADTIQCVVSPDRRFYCFSVNEELYRYDVQEMQLTKVFSFHFEGEHPLRSLKKDYAIRIMEVSDEGRVEFAVYGYMNAGEREGSCGISYCVFEPEDRRVYEQVFMPSEQEAASLMQEVQRLFVKGQDNFLYFILDEELLVMDVDTGETAVLVPRYEYPSLMVSESGRIFVWASETDQKTPGAVRIINLNSGEKRTLTANAGEFIRPLGFLREDMVLGYGPSRSEMVFDGLEYTIPYSRFEILDESLSPISHYEPEDIWIDHVEVGDDKLVIHRFSFTEGQYRYLEPDVVLRSDKSNSDSGILSAHQHESLKSMQVLRCPGLPSSLRIDQDMTRAFVKGPVLGRLTQQHDALYSRRFFTYGKSGLMGSYSELGPAISAAGEANGFVMNREGGLAWFWASRRDEKIIEVGENVMNPGPEWEEVSGADLRELLTFLNEERPVRWVSPDHGDVWLIGYEWKNVIMYNPENANVFRMLQTDFDELIRRDNNYLWISAR